MVCSAREPDSVAAGSRRVGILVALPGGLLLAFEVAWTSSME